MSIKTFNKIFGLKKITCIECGVEKQGEKSYENPCNNEWWLCPECEDIIEAQLQCFDNDVNYNLSNNF